MIGNYNNKLDQKGRIMIPAKLREELGKKVILSLGFDSTLEIRNPNDFDAWVAQLNKNNTLNKDARIILRAILGNSFELNVDGHGRINIPQTLINSINLKDDVVLVGVNDKIEIHAAEKWNAFMETTAKGILEEAATNLDKKA